MLEPACFIFPSLLQSRTSLRDETPGVEWRPRQITNIALENCRDLYNKLGREIDRFKAAPSDVETRIICWQSRANLRSGTYCP